MEKPVQWMTLPGLRDELERTCPSCGRPRSWRATWPMASFLCWARMRTVTRARTTCFADPALTTHLRY
jgi:hypothetical protein